MRKGILRSAVIAAAVVSAAVPASASAYGDQYFIPNGTCQGAVSVVVPLWGNVAANVSTQCAAWGSDTVYLYLRRNGVPVGSPAGGGYNWSPGPSLVGHRYTSPAIGLVRAQYQACVAWQPGGRTFCSQPWNY